MLDRARVVLRIWIFRLLVFGSFRCSFQREKEIWLFLEVIVAKNR